MRLPQPVRRAISVWVGVPNVPAARRWALVAVVDAIGTGMFLPVSVLYFTVVVGLRTELAGLGLGIAGLLGAVALPIAGTLVDRFGAKAMVAGCLLLAAAGYGGYLGVRGWASFVLVATVAQIAEHMANPAKKAFVTTIVSSEHRVPLMAFQRAIRNLGYGLGGLITAALLVTGTRSGYYVVLIADAASYLAAAGLVATIPVLRRAGPAGYPPPEPAGSGRARRAGYRQVLADRRYVALALLDVLVLTYATSFTIGMPLWVHEHTSAPTSLVGVLFTLNTALVAVLQVRLTRGCTRVHQTPRVYLRTAGTFALAALGYWVAYRLGDAEAAVIAVLVVAVLAHTMTEMYGAVAEWTVSVNLAPENLRGRYLSLFALSLSAQQAVGPALVTVLIAASPAVTWFGLAAILAVGCLVTAWVVRGAAEPQEAPESAGPAPPAALTTPAQPSKRSGQHATPQASR